MKKVSIVAILSLFFLTGCGLLPLSADEKSYVADCKKVQTNFEKYMKIQDKFEGAGYNDANYDWQFWSGSYPVTNAGQGSRDSASYSIRSQFPWVDSITRNYFQNKSKEEFLSKSISDWSSDDLESTLFEGYFQMLASGSSFKVTVASLKKIDSDFYYLDLNKVFGSFAPSDRFKNCDEALGLKGETSFEELNNDYGLYGLNGVDIRTVLDTSIGIWGCEKYGVGYVDYGKGWTKCAGSDFDSSKYAITSCTGSLKITVNSATYGDCGKLRFEVFQADKNTGDCLALGWWNDKNGVQQVGAFRFCGLEEGYSYNTEVTVGTEYTYTNNFGVEKTVLGFNSR